MKENNVKLTKCLGFATLTTLAACAVTSLTPAISSFNEASVAIQLDGTSMNFATDQVKAESIAKADRLAAETCRRGPNRKAEFASSRSIPTGQYSFVMERLYLCLR